MKFLLSLDDKELKKAQIEPWSNGYHSGLTMEAFAARMRCDLSSQVVLGNGVEFDKREAAHVSRLKIRSYFSENYGCYLTDEQCANVLYGADLHLLNPIHVIWLCLNDLFEEIGCVFSECNPSYGSPSPKKPQDLRPVTISCMESGKERYGFIQKLHIEFAAGEFIYDGQKLRSGPDKQPLLIVEVTTCTPLQLDAPIELRSLTIQTSEPRLQLFLTLVKCKIVQGDLAKRRKRKQREQNPANSRIPVVTLTGREHRHCFGGYESLNVYSPELTLTTFSNNVSVLMATYHDFERGIFFSNGATLQDADTTFDSISRSPRREKYCEAARDRGISDPTSEEFKQSFLEQKLVKVIAQDFPSPYFSPTNYANISFIAGQREHNPCYTLLFCIKELFDKKLGYNLLRECRFFDPTNPLPLAQRPFFIIAPAVDSAGGGLRLTVQRQYTMVKVPKQVDPVERPENQPLVVIKIIVEIPLRASIPGGDPAYVKAVLVQMYAAEEWMQKIVIKAAGLIKKGALNKWSNDFVQQVKQSQIGASTRV